MFSVFFSFLSELCAGLGGGSRGRSHLQCDTEEGSDPTGGQQGSEMAGGECARLTSQGRVTADEAFSKRKQANPEPSAKRRKHTKKPELLFFFSTFSASEKKRPGF